MPTKKKLRPRKQPTQERAQATVDAILQAATYILVDEGFERLTTNRVADRAGVNIASLYQYFPNKEAIVAELQRLHVQRAREGLPRLLPELGRQRSLRSMLRLMIEAGVAEHRVAPALHRVFTEELPRSVRRLDLGEPPVQPWRDLVAPFVKNVPDLDLSSFVTRVAVHAVIHEAACDRPELLGDPRLVDELVTLLERFLVRPAPRPAPRPGAGGRARGAVSRP